MMGSGGVGDYRLVATMTIKRARISASHSMSSPPLRSDLPGGCWFHPRGRTAKRKKSPRLAGTLLRWCDDSRLRFLMQPLAWGAVKWEAEVGKWICRLGCRSLPFGWGGRYVACEEVASASATLPWYGWFRLTLVALLVHDQPDEEDDGEHFGLHALTPSLDGVTWQACPRPDKRQLHLQAAPGGIRGGNSIDRENRW